jgi:hypothetical protein
VTDDSVDDPPPFPEGKETADLRSTFDSFGAKDVRMQFERFGYFVSDRHEHRARTAVFNHVVTLRDTKLR